MANQVNGLEKATNLGQSDIGHPMKRAGRRDFLRGLGLGAAGAAAVGATGFSRTSALAQQADNDVAILEFALNLEYLEAEFYLRAAEGHGLGPTNLGSNPGPVTGGHIVPFSSPLVAAYAREIADEERKHVEFLRAALAAATGQPAISCPAIDFTESFPTLGSAAGLGSNFDPFENDMDFLLGAYVFEDVGVTAYHGALTLITNPAYLDKAGGILAVEAYHAGIIRTVLFANGKNKADGGDLQPARHPRRHRRHSECGRSWRRFILIADTVDNPRERRHKRIAAGRLPHEQSSRGQRDRLRSHDATGPEYRLRFAECVERLVLSKRAQRHHHKLRVSTTISKPRPMPSLGRGAFGSRHFVARSAACPQGRGTSGGRETTPHCGTATIFRFYSVAKNRQLCYRVLVDQNYLRALRNACAEVEETRRDLDLLGRIWTCLVRFGFTGKILNLVATMRLPHAFSRGWAGRRRAANVSCEIGQVFEKT